MRFSDNLIGDGIFADAYAQQFTHTPVISGDAVFGGAAVTAPPDYIYSFISEGSIYFSGDTQTSQGYEPFLSGSIYFSGEADIAITANLLTFGSLNFSGTGVHTFSPNILGSGSITFLQSHTLNIIRNYTPTKSIDFSGETLTEQTIEYTYTPGISGEVLFPGTAALAYVPAAVSIFSYIGSGGFALSGIGDIITLFNTISSGRINFTGSGNPDNPTDHQNTEIVEFTLVIKRSKELKTIIDRNYETDIQITRGIDLDHVL